MPVSMVRKPTFRHVLSATLHAKSLNYNGFFFLSRLLLRARFDLKNLDNYHLVYLFL